MQVWIERPVEPTKLVLAWQAPDAEQDRLRWAVGVIDISPKPSFRYFSEFELPFHNADRRLDQLRRVGFSGYPAFRYEPGATFSEDVLKTFMRRMPPASRGDFEQYLAYFSIQPKPAASDWALLALTEARLPSDGFSLVDPLNPLTASGDTAVEIAGFRYESGNTEVQPGDLLTLVAEPSNIFDRNAVSVFRAGNRIGYVNRLQAPSVRVWLESRQLKCQVLRKNGRTDAPRAYAKISVSPKASELAA